MKLSANMRTRNPQSWGGDLKEIGGRGAGSMVNMLSDSLENLRQQAQYTVVIGDKTALSLKFLKDELSLLSDTITAELAPGIAKVVPYVLKFATFAHEAAKMLARTVAEVGPMEILKAFANPSEFSTKLANAFGDAAASAGLNVALKSMEIDNRIANLVNQQKKRELFGGADLLPEEDRHKGAKIYTDELLKVGNFLGSASNPMISIGQAQVSYLRQIADNTKPDRAGPEEIFPPL
jgi:hypothetical protein